MIVQLSEGDRVVVCWPPGEEKLNGVVEQVNTRRGMVLVRLDNGLTMRMALDAFLLGDEAE